jgi:adenylate cyclase
MTQERAEKAVAQDASNGAALGYGAVSLAVLGEGARAREWIDRALMIDPENNTMRYNLACSLATYLKDSDAAIELLGPYFERVSVSELKHCSADPDMDPLRDDPRFQQMAAAAAARLSQAAPIQTAQIPPIAAS